MTSGREFYDRHIALLEAMNVDELVARQYDENAVLVGFDFTVRGREALSKHLSNYLKQLGGLKVKSTDNFIETGEAIFFEATVETVAGVAKVYDAFMLNDQNKATYQFTGLKSFTPFQTGSNVVTTSLTESEVRAMAVQWYGGLDNHLPEVEMLKFLVSEGLEQQWPDYHVQSLVDFEGWYQRALRLFFDEVHTLKEFTVTPSEDGSKADVKVFVNWQARVWTPGDARSKYLNLDIHQTWIVVPSPETGKPLIKFIRVDDATPLEGSDSL